MVTLIAIIHGLSRWQRAFNPDPEVIRKALHVVMGLVTLSFPWIFTDSWPVLALSIISSLFIAVLKVSKMKNWSTVICAKGRQSIGEICFPLAVGLTFFLADGNTVLYLVPIIILTLADAASAIIGQRYGKKQYGTSDGHKSVEGSLTFAAIAFVSSYFPLVLTAHVGSPEAMVISTILAVLAMMFEGIGWKGLDNLFVPIGAFIVLKTHILLPLAVLVPRLGLLLFLCMIVLLSRRNSTLNGSGLLGTALFCYYCCIIGGTEWIIMPAILYLSYRFLLPARFRHMKGAHSVYAVISVASMAVIWLLIAHVSNSDKFIFPYALTFGAHAAIIATAHMRFTTFTKSRVFILLYGILKAWCLMCIPLVLLEPTSHMLLITIVLAPFCIGIPTVLFHIANTCKWKPITRTSRWWKQASFAAFGSALGLLAFL